VVETLLEFPRTTKMQGDAPTTNLARCEGLNQKLSLHQVLKHHAQDEREACIFLINEERSHFFETQVLAVIDLQLTHMLVEILLAHFQIVLSDDLPH
jgi:hypothetical protein